MTPILLFQYLLSIAGGVLVIGAAGLAVLCAYFVLIAPLDPADPPAQGEEVSDAESP